MDQAFSEILATNVWKLFPFRVGNRVWVIILLKAYFCCVLLGFCLACILNAVEGKRWLQSTIRGNWGVVARGDTALDECFWFVFTTMHGIGFGEFMARGVAGRLIAMFCCAIGYWFTIFMMSIIMLSQLPGEKAPSLYNVTARMVSALWPSYSVFLALVLAIGAVVGPYVSKDHEGRNEWPTGMYWTWTVVHRTPYGDIFPDTVFGRTVTVPIACMGVLYMPYALACIAVRCPSMREHREIVGHLRQNPDDALGRGYVQPPEAAGANSLSDYVMHDGPFQEQDDEDSHRGRSCIAVCILLTFTIITCMLFGGSAGIFAPAKLITIPAQIEHILDLDLPPGLRSSTDPVPPIIWTFWLHDYPLEGAGLQTLENMKVTTDVTVQLVTPDILNQYNVTEAPFHKAMNHLAPNHKLDYLHAYFMHHYGGGFMEIQTRKHNSTWTAPFEYIGGNDTFWVLGTPSKEDVTCDESNIGDAWCKELQFKTDGITYAETKSGMSSWAHSKGPCCAKVLKYYSSNTTKEDGNFDITSLFHDSLWPTHSGYIMRKGTDFTKEWLDLVDQHLNAKLPELKKSPAPAENCCLVQQGSYPLRWDELRGEIWSVLLRKYKQHVKYDASLL